MKEVKEVNIQKIMEEIREEAEKRRESGIPEFLDIRFRVIQNVDSEYHYINTNWNIPYYLELKSTGIKKQVMRIIRKLICFVVKPQRDAQNELNSNLVRLINYLQEITKEQQLQIEDLQRKVRRLENTDRKVGESR